MSVPPEEIAYQQAHAGDFNADGLSTFCIVGELVVAVAVLLRVWSRKLAGIGLQADDYTLIVAMFLSLTAVILMDVRVYHQGFGRHWLTLTTEDHVRWSKIDYVFNLFYTTGYPLSRISLVLLYKRIFVQQWFHYICWFFIAIFSGYMISTVVVDVLLDIPVSAYWDSTITPTHSVDVHKLYIANAAFNITTDSILLILPLTIVWRLRMTWIEKAGLTAIFGMGALTLVASIARLVFFDRAVGADPTYSLVPDVWWTAAELFLGILCPCLVTFRPLFRSVHHFVSSRITLKGYSHTSDSGVEHSVETDKEHSNYHTNRNRYESGSRSKSTVGSDVLVGAASGRGEDGMALDQEFALATLDPRVRTRD